MSKEAKSLEDVLIQALLLMGIITPQFTGAITLHFTNGGLGDVDRLEKSLKRKKKYANKVYQDFQGYPDDLLRNV